MTAASRDFTGISAAESPGILKHAGFFGGSISRQGPRSHGKLPGRREHREIVHSTDFRTDNSSEDSEVSYRRKYLDRSPGIISCEETDYDRTPESPTHIPGGGP